jgi:outer membrane protein OmpA-like peptidoglycan-associated protein
MVPLACINAGQYWKGQDRQFHKDMSLLTTRHDAAQPHETTAWRFASVQERSTVMSGKIDQIRRNKEAAGAPAILPGGRTTKRRLLAALLPLCAVVLVAVACTGPAGPAGPTGMTGMTGAQGSTGMTGVQGSTGMTGVQGSAGITGVQGPAGIAGAQGAPASSRWTLVKEFMFDFDRSDIRNSESRKPAEVAAYMSQNPSMRLGLAGYTKRQSTDQYNLPLSQRRVATVRDALIQAGVPADRIETGTFGTDRFMCNPSTEQCLQREGRVEVLVRASS